VTDGPGRRRRAFVALLPTYLSVFLFVAGGSALSVVMPVYLSREAKLGPAAIGVIIGAFAVASLATRLPAGLSYSARRGAAFLLAGGACSAVAFALVPFTTSAVVCCSCVGATSRRAGSIARSATSRKPCT